MIGANIVNTDIAARLTPCYKTHLYV